MGFEAHLYIMWYCKKDSTTVGIATNLLEQIQAEKSVSRPTEVDMLLI